MKTVVSLCYFIIIFNSAAGYLTADSGSDSRFYILYLPAQSLPLHNMHVSYHQTIVH